MTTDSEFVRALCTETWMVNFNNAASGEVTEDNPGDRTPADFELANAYSSQIKNAPRDWHVVLLDIDGIPARLIPSSTPGNCHIIVDHPVQWGDYLELLRLLVKMGIVEEGYANMAELRGAAFLRMPGEHKDTGDTLLDDTWFTG